MKQIITALFITTLLLAACHSQKNARRTGINNNLTADTSHPLTGKKWLLTQLYGKRVSDTAASSEKQPVYLEFQPDLIRVNGFSGCNGFGGEYHLKGGNRIRFTKVIGTMMACDRLETEKQLYRVLKTATTYMLIDNTLQLKKGRMAPMAIFEAK